MNKRLRNITILAALVIVVVLVWRRYGSKLSAVLPS